MRGHRRLWRRAATDAKLGQPFSWYIAQESKLSLTPTLEEAERALHEWKLSAVFRVPVCRLLPNCLPLAWSGPHVEMYPEARSCDYNSIRQNATMPIPPDEFQQKVKDRVRAHYAANRTPLLLAHLGAEIEKSDEWPTDRGQRNLKQLITDTCAPDLQIVWDRRSPAYIAVVTPEVRADVEAQIADRFADKEPVPVRLEEIVRSVLLAFCVNAQNEPVYIKRTRPFRYEVGSIPPDRTTDYILVEPEYRRPGLRIDRLHLLPLSDRKDLEGLIQKWAAVHGLQVEQFSRVDQDEKEQSEAGGTALDRLLTAQPPDIARRIMIPADIAQILSRIR